MIAYYIIHSPGPLGLVINLVIYLIIAIILFMVIRIAAAEFGVSQRIVQLLGLLIFLVLILTLFVGCATNTADPVKNAHNAGLNAAGKAALGEAGKVLGRAAVSALFSVAQTELTGGKADFGQAAAQGLWSQAQTGITETTIFNITTAFSAGKATQTAFESAAAASVAIDGGKDPAKVASAIASVISTASGAPPAK